ncbi:MAG: SufB/SufD family protein, partial [Steroidobacteraceae bacterium]
MNAEAASPFLGSIARGHAAVAASLAAAGATAQVRRAALDRFLAAGLPTTRDENWKYLILRSLARRELPISAPPAPLARLPSGILSLPDAARLVFVNGRLDAALSTPSQRRAGLRIETLTETYRRQPELLARALPADDRADSRFALLNTAFVPDGASIEFDGGAAPLVYVVFLATGNGASFPRLRIRATGGSTGVVVEHHIGDTSGAGFVNSLAEIEVGGGARVELCRLHALEADGQQFDTLRARVAAGSTFAMDSLAVAGDVLRSDVDIALEGAAAAGQLRGLLFTSGSQHHELHAEIRHGVAQTTSRTEVRAVVNDGGRAICNSKVIVDPGAKRSVSEQNFRNLLLAPGAEADTRPQLEIHNEDVKCSHGASTGRLDPNQLLYLTTRGIDAATARALLTHAFVIDLLKAVPVPA